MANILVFIVFFSSLRAAYTSNLGKCIKQNACVCKFNEHSLVNLTNIIGNQKPPYLTDTDSVTNATYFFSGCQNATIDNITFTVSNLNIFFFKDLNHCKLIIYYFSYSKKMA